MYKTWSGLGLVVDVKWYVPDWIRIYLFNSIAADTHSFDADPDPNPAFCFDLDLDPDPAFHYDADPDTGSGSYN